MSIYRIAVWNGWQAENGKRRTLPTKRENVSLESNWLESNFIGYFFCGWCFPLMLRKWKNPINFDYSPGEQCAAINREKSAGFRLKRRMRKSPCTHAHTAHKHYALKFVRSIHFMIVAVPCDNLMLWKELLCIGIDPHWIMSAFDWIRTQIKKKTEMPIFCAISMANENERCSFHLLCKV